MRLTGILEGMGYKLLPPGNVGWCKRCSARFTVRTADQHRECTPGQIGYVELYMKQIEKQGIRAIEPKH